ncbi:MAG: endonuclease domain-containing protein [Bacteroidaceae bacterium]|nr:endonuclease domain-containing protein [Bacteroidaceae bacterium]
MEIYNRYAYQNATPAYYAKLKEWAKEMRANPTLAEAALRNRVRANRLGHKFLYQYIIGQYIVDFMCPDCRLIIEVDGDYHSTIMQQSDDIQRSQWLEENGYTVIRFTNEQVLNDMGSVIREIEKYLNKN